MGMHLLPGAELFVFVTTQQPGYSGRSAYFGVSGQRFSLVTIHGLCVRELTHFVRYGPDAV